ncbi:MAG TPA: DUF1707 domain-containing protein [Actinomycetes bacterium]
MSATDPVPRRALRASDQDRHEAILALSDQFVAGRLDHDEFERRMTAAAQATYLHDLHPLFADLPARSVAVPQPGRRRPSNLRDRVHLPVSLVTFAVVFVVVATHGFALWLLLPLWWLWVGGAHRRACPHHPAAAWSAKTSRRW